VIVPFREKKTGLSNRTLSPLYLIFYSFFNLIIFIINYNIHEILLMNIDFSIIGGIIIAVGLYSVVWGKGKDYVDETSSSPARTKETETMQLPVTSPNNK